ALGAVSYAGLLAGAVMGSLTRTPHRRIAAAMSVGAGLLLAGASLRVAADAIRLAGLVPAAPSLLLGAAACAPPAAATRTSLRSGARSALVVRRPSRQGTSRSARWARRGRRGSRRSAQAPCSR